MEVRHIFKPFKYQDNYSWVCKYVTSTRTKCCAPGCAHKVCPVMGKWNYGGTAGSCPLQPSNTHIYTGAPALTCWYLNSRNIYLPEKPFHNFGWPNMNQEINVYAPHFCQQTTAPYFLNKSVNPSYHSYMRKWGRWERTKTASWKSQLENV